MHEIIIRQIAFGADGGPANLANGIELPIDNETLDRTMMCMKVKYPYIAHSYSFRLDGLNGQITGPQAIEAWAYILLITRSFKSASKGS